MKRFKQFLKETPLFTEHIKCPDGSHVEPFVVALEDANVANKKDVNEIAKRFFNKQGEVPVYCTEQNNIFIYNFDNGKGRKVKSRTDKITAGMLINGLYRYASGRGNNAKLAESIKDDNNFGWSLPVEVWDTRNLLK